jgi:type I restriction-modification system DNA methylase subunit/restriction endonuclease S subunit
MTTIAQLTTVFKNILNILRDNESLTGEKALRNMSLLLILKMIEPRIEKEIMIDNYYFRNIEQYDLNKFLGDTIEEKQKEKSDFIAKMKRLTRLSNFVELQMVDYSKNILNLWTFVLSQHHILNKVFDNNKFDIKGSFTFFHVIKQLNSIDLNECDLDVLGAAYEEVIQDIFVGKVLGQFFTPLAVKKIMIDLIKPVVTEDGKIESCCDPTMGTGGFLISYVKEIIRQSKEKGIELDWSNISQNMYGKEIEIDTYKLAISNMLIATGHMFNALERGDSIRDPILKQYDCVLANPPFGIKGLKYTEFYYEKKHEYIPIKTDNAVSLFLQAIIFMLKVGGRCAIVLPDGQDLFSKTNKALVAVREYLMKSCDLQEIICLPANTFTYTSIKTCVFYFVKKREMKDAMELKIKSMNKHPFSEISRNYNFVKEHATTSVKFYEMDTFYKEKKLLIEVPVDTLSKNAYSLNYMEYMKKSEEAENVNLQVKLLGEVCQFKNGKGLKRENIITGEYPVIGGGTKPIGFHNQYNTNANSILCSSSGANAGYISRYEKPVWASDCFSIVPDEQIILNDYLYYILKNQQDKIYKLQKGLAQPHVYSSDLKELKIPIPSLETQQEMVEYFEFIYEVQIKISQKKIEGLKELNDRSIKQSQKVFCSTEVKTLGEVIHINFGTRITRKNNIHGIYPVFGSGKATFFTNSFNRDSFNVLVGRFALSSECVRLTNEKLFLNDSGFSIKPKTEILLHKYVAYFLYVNQDKIYDCARGMAQKNLDIEEFKSIHVPIPTLEQQKEIVEYCEYIMQYCKNNNDLISQLEKEISDNKAQLQKYLETVMKSSKFTFPEVQEIKNEELQYQEPQEESNSKRHKSE